MVVQQYSPWFLKQGDGRGTVSVVNRGLLGVRICIIDTCIYPLEIGGRQTVERGPPFAGSLGFSLLVGWEWGWRRGGNRGEVRVKRRRREDYHGKVEVGVGRSAA